MAVDSVYGRSAARCQGCHRVPAADDTLVTISRNERRRLLRGSTGSLRVSAVNFSSFACHVTEQLERHLVRRSKGVGPLLEPDLVL